MQFDPEINETLRKYFTFSRREYKATVALFIITISVWFFPDIKNHFFPPTFDSSLIEQKLKILEGLQIKNDANENRGQRNGNSSDDSIKINEEHPSPIYFSFNPNTANDDDFERLGFSKKQIKIIKNFRAKIGEIKCKADFKKIYGITESQYASLDPYIDLPELKPGKVPEPNTIKKKKEVLSIELNSADSIEFDKLPGIGMGYARRIIKYRSALGGFININQLLEVYGFRQSLLDTIIPFIWLDNTKITLLNINTASADDLKKHPYIRYKIANAIVNYRNQHGKFNTIDDTKNVVLITPEIYDKIKSYITVD